MVFIEELFYSDMLPYAAGFLIIFATVFFLLNRSIFRENRAVSTIISACISFLTIWGLVTKTEIWYSFEEIFAGLGDPTQAILFFAIAIAVLFLLYKGLSKNMGKINFPWLSFGLSALFIFAYFSPNFISTYYLPDWILDYRTGFLIAGIIFGVLGILRLGKKEEVTKIQIKKEKSKGLLKKIFGR